MVCTFNECNRLQASAVRLWLGAHAMNASWKTAAQPAGPAAQKLAMPPLRESIALYPLPGLQVQYSLLDRRPDNGMIEFCAKHDIKLVRIAQCCKDLRACTALCTSGKK